MLLNSPNILSWYNSTTPSGYLPMAHIRNKCANSHVVWAIGEQMSFYINAHIPVPLSGTSNLQMVSVGVSGSPFDFGSINNYGTTLNNNYYGTIICPSIAKGTYMLELTVGSNIYRSATIDVIPLSEAAETTIQVRFRNKFTKNNVPYPYSPITSFYQKFRLRATWLATEPRLSKDVMVDSDSSLPREFNQQESFLRKILFYQLDSNMIDGLAAMFSHDFIEINGKKYRTDSALSVQPFGRNGLANAEIVVEDLALNYFTRV